MVPRQPDQLSFAARREASLDERFREFLSANPQVLVLFIRFALEAKASGRKVGAKAIVERMRWEVAMTTSDPEGWKLNNSYVSRLARRAMEEVPALRGFFETRSLHTKEGEAA